MIEYACPHCSRPMASERALAGFIVVCLGCQKRVTVPRSQSQVMASPPAAPPASAPLPVTRPEMAIAEAPPELATQSPPPRPAWLPPLELPAGPGLADSLVSLAGGAALILAGAGVLWWILPDATPAPLFTAGTFLVAAGAVLVCRGCFDGVRAALRLRAVRLFLGGAALVAVELVEYQ